MRKGMQNGYKKKKQLWIFHFLPGRAILPLFAKSMFGGGAFEAKNPDFGFSRRHFSAP